MLNIKTLIILISILFVGVILNIWVATSVITTKIDASEQRIIQEMHQIEKKWSGTTHHFRDTD